MFFKLYFKKSPKAFYLRMIVYSVIVIAVGALTYLCCYFIPSQGYGWFALKCGICLILPNLMFFLVSFKTPEFKYVVAKTKNIFKRNKRESNKNAE